jgi:type I restriction enzyme S subunit
MLKTGKHINFKIAMINSIFPYNRISEGSDFMSGYAFKSKDFSDHGIPVIKIKNIQNRKVVYLKDQFYPTELLKEGLDKFKVKRNDVLIAMTGQGSVGRVGQVKEMKDSFGLLNQRVGKFICDEINLNRDYLFYVISSSYYEAFLFNKAIGSGQPNLSPSDIIEVEIPYPPLPEQTQIANILSAIDDKIENNLAINKTLEDMAMALYKHWFVDFGPFQDGEFIDSELGLIPKGWEVKIIGNVIDTLGGGTPKTTENSYWENGDILWYSPTDLTRDNAMFSLDSSKRINNLGLLKSSAKLFPPYSLLMSSRATIGALTINTIKASTNQGFITMIPNDNMSVYQLYSWTKWNMDLIISKSNGSTFKEISKANFRSLEIVVGQNIELFLRESKNIFDKVENNIQENQSLTKLRDTLLPKLISGEVRLKEFREGIDAEMNSA